MRVDAARHHRQLAKAAALQVAPQRFGGHHRALRAVMELAQVGHDRLVQPAHAVVPAVGVEVGAEVRTHRQLQLQRGLQRRPAQRPFGGDVHDVGPVLATTAAPARRLAGTPMRRFG